MIESSPRDGGRANLRTRRYALPGDKFTAHELNRFDVEKKTQTKPEVGLIDFRDPRLRWTQDGRYFRYQKIKYFSIFDNSIVSDYIVSKTFNTKSKFKYIWD